MKIALVKQNKVAIQVKDLSSWGVVFWLKYYANNDTTNDPLWVEEYQRQFICTDFLAFYAKEEFPE